MCTTNAVAPAVHFVPTYLLSPRVAMEELQEALAAFSAATDRVAQTPAPARTLTLEEAIAAFELTIGPPSPTPRHDSWERKCGEEQARGLPPWRSQRSELPDSFRERSPPGSASSSSAPAGATPRIPRRRPLEPEQAASSSSGEASAQSRKRPLEPEQVANSEKSFGQPQRAENSDVTFEQPQQAQNSEETFGQFLERNGPFEPWAGRMLMRLVYGKKRPSEEGRGLKYRAQKGI